jgi:hypothetical protein
MNVASKLSMNKRVFSLCCLAVLSLTVLGCAPVTPEELAEIDALEAELKAEPGFVDDLELADFHLPGACPHVDPGEAATRDTSKKASALTPVRFSGKGGERGQCESCHNQGAGGFAIKQAPAKCSACHDGTATVENPVALVKPVALTPRGGGCTSSACHGSSRGPGT